MHDTVWVVLGVGILSLGLLALASSRVVSGAGAQRLTAEMFGVIGIVGSVFLLIVSTLTVLNRVRYACEPDAEEVWRSADGDALRAVSLRGGHSLLLSEREAHLMPTEVVEGHVLARGMARDSGSWSQWGVDAPVRAILTRSSDDLWFGAQSIFHLDHGGSCTPRSDAVHELVNEQSLRSPARDVAIEGDGVWLATDGCASWVGV